MRCDLCGKFRKDSEVVGMSAENPDEVWHECTKCMSWSDLERYFPELYKIEKEKRCQPFS